MKLPLSFLPRDFFPKKREVLTTKLTAAAAYAVLAMLLVVTAFAKDGEVTIVTTSLPNATVGTFYTGTVTAMDGCTPYKWSIVGSLPAGLSATHSSSTTTITISGTPSEAGSINFGVQVEGCGRHTAQKTYTVSIQSTYSVNLNWDASTSPNISGYNVYRGTTSGGPYAEINNGGLVSGTTYADSTVASGTTYYYVTTAVNSSDQQSAYSAQITVQIP
jgi:hypothetical protein